jgi:hypothetical protein
MDRGLEKVKERLRRVAEALRRANLAYAVVGGNAVAAWVSRVDEAAVRNTRDVDVLLRRADFDQIKTALAQVGFVHRRVTSLGKAGVMDVFLDGPDAKVRDAVHVLWAGENVLPDSVAPSPAVTEAEDAGGFMLINLEPLVRMKLTSFRDKDRMHLRDLLAVNLIDEAWLARFAEPLRGRLLTILNDPEG